MVYKHTKSLDHLPEPVAEKAIVAADAGAGGNSADDEFHVDGGILALEF